LKDVYRARSQGSSCLVSLGAGWNPFGVLGIHAFEEEDEEEEEGALMEEEDPPI
jgi:hypothetical protein